MAESISAKTAWALAKAIKGGSKKKLPNSGTATVVRVDQDGTHWVRISGSDVETPVNGAITADAKPGDVVQYRLEDTRIAITGNATSPSVGKEYVNDMVEPVEAKVGVVAKANELLNTATERARSVADAAKSVADAVNQHFFADTSGIHVTEATQDEWEASHSGANVLINSIGQLFRDGLNNLLTLTTENGARALTVWDGLGNAASNIRAIIGETIQLGSTASGNYMTLDSDGVEIHNSNNLSANIGYDYVSLLNGEFELIGEIEASAGHGRDYWTRHCSYIRHKHYAKATMPSINLYDQETISGETGAKGYTSGIKLNGTTECDSSISGVYQLIALNTSTGNSISLRSNMAGNRGLYDVTNDEWILYRDTNDNLVLGSLKQYTGSCTVDTSNATIAGNVNYCWKNDAVCTITITVNLKSSLASGSVVTVATAPSGYRPPHAVMGQVYITGQSPAQLQAQISAAGAINLNNRSGSAVGTSANIYISFTFAL